MNTTLPRSRTLLSGLSAAAILACEGAFAQAVIPGEFTDPTNLRRMAQDSSDYKTPDNLKFPYVSTYYVQPTVEEGEPVKIGFYVTDWDHSKVRFLDDSFRFDVFLEFFREGGEPKRLSKTKVPSGDGEFDLGPLPAGDYALRVWARDVLGRESHRVWQEFRVLAKGLRKPAKAYRMRKDDLAKYSIRNDGNFGCEFPVEIGELPEKPKNADIAAAVSNAFERVVAAGNLPRACDGPGYTVLVPARNGRPINRSFAYARVIADGEYDTNAVERTAIATAEGLQKLIDEKAAEGFDGLVLLPGCYRISASRAISVPDRFTLDLNGATLKENAFTGAHSVLVRISSAYDAHLVNGTLEGDYYEHDYAGSPNNSEWPLGFSIGGDARYSTVERVNVRNITGYGGGNGIGKDERGDLCFVYQGVGKYEAGGLNPADGSLDESDAARFTTGYLDLAKLKDHKYLQVSKYLGYQGRVTRSWQMVACWYDAATNHIASETLFQYRAVRIPEKAAFLRYSVETASKEEADKSGLVMTLFRVPVNCAVVDCRFERCRAVGYAASAMKNMLFKGNEFCFNGEALAKCAFDAEDGWDQMQDVYFLENRCHDNPVNDSLLTCAGHNFVFERNRCGLYFWGRTYSPCVRDNDLTYGTYRCDSRLRSGYGRFENNRYSQSVAIEGPDSHPGWDYVLSGLDIASTNAFSIKLGQSGRLVGCRVANREATVAHASGCVLTNCSAHFVPVTTWHGMFVDGCDIHYLYKTNLYSQCAFRDTRFHTFREGFQTFEDCTFENCSFWTLTDANIRFVRCSFKGGEASGGWWSLPSRVEWRDCEFELAGKPFLRLPGYTIGDIVFEKCRVKCGGGAPAALIDVHDLRPQPTDGKTGVITLRECEFGAGVANAVVVSATRMGASGKKIAVKAEGVRFAEAEGAVVSTNDLETLPSWTVTVR